MHMVLLTVYFGLGAPRELGRGPLLPCDHCAKEGQHLLQWLLRFVPDSGARADFFSTPPPAFAGEKVAVNVWWEGGCFFPGVGSYCVAMPSETALSCMGRHRAAEGSGSHTLERSVTSSQSPVHSGLVPPCFFWLSCGFQSCVVQFVPVFWLICFGGGCRDERGECEGRFTVRQIPNSCSSRSTGISC